MTDAKSGVLQKKCPTKKGHAKKNRSTRDKTKTNLSDQAKVVFSSCHTICYKKPSNPFEGIWTNPRKKNYGINDDLI